MTAIYKAKRTPFLDLVPKYHEKPKVYYYIDSEGKVQKSSISHLNDSWDRHRYLFGNMFFKKSAAINASKAIKLLLSLYQ